MPGFARQVFDYFIKKKVLKKYIRKSHQPLQQVVKRYREHTTYGLKFDMTKNNSNSFTFKNIHTDGWTFNERIYAIFWHSI